MILDLWFGSVLVVTMFCTYKIYGRKSYLHVDMSWYRSIYEEAIGKSK